MSDEEHTKNLFDKPFTTLLSLKYLSKERQTITKHNPTRLMITVESPIMSFIVICRIGVSSQSTEFFVWNPTGHVSHFSELFVLLN